MESTCIEHMKELIRQGPQRAFPIWSKDINKLLTQFSIEEVREAAAFLSLKYPNLLSSQALKVLNHV